MMLERWSAQWEDELNAAYTNLLRHCESNGYAFFQHLSYDTFVEFMYKVSSGFPPSF